MNQNKENKTMKKLYFTMLLMAGLALTACSSDDNSTEPEPQAPKTYYMTVDASKAVNEAFSRMSTRALSLDGSTLNASWATKENVYVQGKLKSDGTTKFWFKGTIKPQYAGTTTRLNGVISLPDGWTYASIDDAIETPHTLTLQFPRSGELDYTGQVGTLADIAAKYDYAVAKDVRVDVEADKVVGVKEVKFVNQQAIVKFTLRDKTDATKLLNPTALTVRVEDAESNLVDEVTLSIPDATYTTNGAGVLFVAIPGFTSQKVTLTATVGDKTYTFVRSGVTFENGHYDEVDVKMNLKSN